MVVCPASLPLPLVSQALNNEILLKNEILLLL
jgi:hypothetical protein